MSTDKFEMWAIVELMGHQKMAGYVSEVNIAGHGFLRIDVPASENQPAFTRFVQPNALYALNPTTEEMAKVASQAFRPRPVAEWELPKALPPSKSQTQEEEVGW